MNTREEIRLVRAAIIAGVSYHRMLNAILRGEVRGRQDANGRWWVRRSDADALARQRATLQSADRS